MTVSCIFCVYSVIYTFGVFDKRCLRHWSGIIISLYVITSQFLQRYHLLLILHALCYKLPAHVMKHGNKILDRDKTVTVRECRPDNTLVQLDHIDRILQHTHQIGISCSIIIQRERETKLFDIKQLFFQPMFVKVGRRLRNLKIDAPRINIVLSVC